MSIPRIVIVGYSMSEVSASAETGAAISRSFARYLRDVVKTHVRNSDVTRGHASASTHWPFMKSRPETHSSSGSAPLGSAGCTRTGEHAGWPVVRSVHSISFICRIIVVFLFAGMCQRASARAQGPARVPSVRQIDCGVPPLVIVFLRRCYIVASLNKRCLPYKVAESRAVTK